MKHDRDGAVKRGETQRKLDRDPLNTMPLKSTFETKEMGESLYIV